MIQLIKELPECCSTGLVPMIEAGENCAYLKTGVGKPWAWHGRERERPVRCSTIRDILTATRGAVLLVGSVIMRNKDNANSNLNS